jgi:hypothetical protein
VTPATSRLTAATSLAAITAVNLLVIVKYAPRVHTPAAAIGGAYLAAVAAGAWFSMRGPRPSAPRRRLLLALLAGLTVVLSLAVLSGVPAGTLRVDRWSAMTAFNSALTQGQFPYLARTHLGNQLWGLPVAYLVGLPFQWLGDVGYLQVAVFLVFAFVCDRLFGRQFDVLPATVLLVASPAFLWEVTARSDLVSNALAVALFLIWSERWRNRKTTPRMIALGAVLGLLACTRIVLAVPMLVYFVGYFQRDETRAARWFLAAASGVFAGVLAPFLLWSPRQFAANNPFQLQAVLSPMPLRVAVVAACLAAGALARDFSARCAAGGLVLAGGVASAFLLQVGSTGWERALVGSGFDISYFDLALPILLVPLLFARPIPLRTREPAGAGR